MNSREVRFARDRAGAAVPPTLAPTPRSGPGRPHRPPRAPFELLNPRAMALALASGVTAGVSVRASSSFVRAKSTSFRAASARRRRSRRASASRSPGCPRRAPALRSRPPRPVRTRGSADARRPRRPPRTPRAPPPRRPRKRRSRRRERRRASCPRSRSPPRSPRSAPRDPPPPPPRSPPSTRPTPRGFSSRPVRPPRTSVRVDDPRGCKFRSSKSLNFGVFNFGSRIAACTRFSDAFSFRHRSFSLEPRAPPRADPPPSPPRLPPSSPSTPIPHASQLSSFS